MIYAIPTKKVEEIFVNVLGFDPTQISIYDKNIPVKKRALTFMTICFDYFEREANKKKYGISALCAEAKDAKSAIEVLQNRFYRIVAHTLKQD